MAEAGAPPTFKLVLVGDGGTGKVGNPVASQTRIDDSPLCRRVVVVEWGA